MSMPIASSGAMQYGAPVGEYRGGVKRIVLGVVGVALLLMGVFFVAMSPGSTTASGDSSGTVSLIIVGVLFIAGAIYSFVTLFFWRGAHAQLFERGFIIARGGKSTSAAWDDVASVTQQVVRMRYYGIPIWVSHKYDITLTNGEKVRVNDGFGQASKLGDAIQRMSANALLPRAIATYHSGAVLPFGKLSVSQAGISNGKDTLPWSDLNQVTLQNGYVIVSRKGKMLRWTSAPVSKTPNLYVLTALVSYIQRGVR